MAKAIKAPDLSATVVWDSNPLFTENEIELVSNDSAKELREIQQTPGIEIVIPRVVAGEILFRKNWGLTLLHNDAAKKLASIRRLADLPQPELCDQERLRRGLQRRFIKWCKEHHVTLWRVPFDKVNWRRLTALAMNRKPPFSPFDPKAKSEKGVRDALILETLCDVHRVFAPKRTVFICGDGLLAGAAVGRLGPDRLAIYKTSAEYLSYLKLQSENFVNEAIRLVLEEAAIMFYSADSPECIYTKFNIPRALHAALPAEFAKTAPSSNLFLTLQPETFTTISAEGYRLGATNIEKFEGNEMIFKSEILAGQAFQSSNQFTPEQLRVVSAAVIWAATWEVSPEIRLHSPRFISVQLEKTTFEVATDDQLKSFNLPTRVEHLLASFKATPPNTENS